MECCHCSGDKQHVLLIYVMCKKMLLLDFPEKSRYNAFIDADNGVRESFRCLRFFYWTKLVKTNRRKRRKKQ